VTVAALASSCAASFFASSYTTLWAADQKMPLREFCCASS
jgi:hypothetical protein